MAESSRRNVLGRVLTVLGFVWILWAVAGDMVAFEMGRNLVSLPLLPGIVLLFIGRAVTRSSRRRQNEELPGLEAEPLSNPSKRRLPPESIRPSSMRPSPPPDPPVERRSIRTSPEPEADAITHALENMQEEIADAVGSAAARKTSAEMVAEARRRFGKQTG